jgi:hypothetical protein
MANKTVQNTQFLYNSANKPQFMSTSLGKVYSRFQTYSFNSLRWRKHILQEASYRGFKPGSEEMNRLNRVMTADMFMLVMGSLFPLSLFDNICPR